MAKIASKYCPPPQAMPTEATTKSVAAVVSPLTLPLACRMDPAPMKPMPGMICAAMRVWSPMPHSAARSLERTVNMAEPKQINILVRRPAGRRLIARSSPMMPPRTAASVSRTMVLESRSASDMCGRMKASVFMGDKCSNQCP